MAYKKIEIGELIDPVIQCGDKLIVNVDKKKSLLAGVFFVGILIVILVLSISEFSGLPIWVLSLMILIALIIMMSNLLSRNPLMKIDKEGVTFKNKEFYSWDSFEKIVYDKDMSNEGSSYFRFYLKEKKEKELVNDGFLDQPISVIATYINKYIRK